MKKVLAAALVGVWAAQAVAASNDPVTQADLQALIERIAKLEAENKAQAAKIAELQGKAAPAEAPKGATGEAAATEDTAVVATKEEGTTIGETGRIYTTDQGYQYYLADKFAGIFEPLSESGLKITPYGYLVMEATHNTRSTDVDVYTDWVRPKHASRLGHTTSFSVQDSILGMRMETPETDHGWKFSGKAEFDFAGDDANDYQFHWRHLYMEGEHAETGWKILAGQTWHIWKMVSPSEIDGAWLENTGYPYRRSPQFRVTKTFTCKDDSSLELRAGIVKNGPGMGGDRDGDGTADNSASAWGLLEGAALYTRKAAWEEEKSWMIGLAGMYGRDKNHRIMEDGSFGTTDEYDSKMVMLAGTVPLTTGIGSFTLTGQLFAGDNLGGIQAGVGQRVAFERGLGYKGREVSTVGGFIDLNYEVNDTWSFAIGYGFDDPTDSEAKYAEGRCYNDRAYIDAFYTVNKNFRLGFEYAHLRTRYNLEEDPGTASDDRFQFTAFYDF